LTGQSDRRERKVLDGADVTLHPRAAAYRWETPGVEQTLGIVVVLVVIAAALVAVATLVASGRTYDQIGRGRLSLRDEAPPVPAGAADARERDDEIRQLLEARNEWRRRHGRAPVDVEAELRALERPPADATLEAEIRQLVQAGNERRARQGREPLDVEAEVARRLRKLRGGG
jgi:hypothetical protein